MQCHSANAVCELGVAGELASVREGRGLDFCEERYKNALQRQESEQSRLEAVCKQLGADCSESDDILVCILAAAQNWKTQATSQQENMQQVRRQVEAQHTAALALVRQQVLQLEKEKSALEQQADASKDEHKQLITQLASKHSDRMVEMEYVLTARNKEIEALKARSNNAQLSTSANSSVAASGDLQALLEELQTDAAYRKKALAEVMVEKETIEFSLAVKNQLLHQVQTEFRQLQAEKTATEQSLAASDHMLFESKNPDAAFEKQQLQQQLDSRVREMDGLKTDRSLLEREVKVLKSASTGVSSLRVEQMSTEMEQLEVELEDSLDKLARSQQQQLAAEEAKLTHQRTVAEQSLALAELATEKLELEQLLAKACQRATPGVDVLAANNATLEQLLAARDEELSAMWKALEEERHQNAQVSQQQREQLDSRLSEADVVTKKQDEQEQMLLSEIQSENQQQLEIKEKQLQEKVAEFNQQEQALTSLSNSKARLEHALLAQEEFLEDCAVQAEEKDQALAEMAAEKLRLQQEALVAQDALELQYEEVARAERALAAMAEEKLRLQAMVDEDEEEELDSDATPLNSPI